MDFAALLEKIPTLLHACVGDDIAALKGLRLVGKEFGRIALLALKSYTLTLKGGPADTNMSSARLLKKTQLKGLHVFLYLSGRFSPALLLQTFVRDVGSALSTVSCLNLHMHEMGSSVATAVVMGKALALLMAACPFLESLTLQGYVCPEFINMVANVCPLVSAIYFHVNKTHEISQMKKMVMQLPSLLPHLTSLGLISTTPIPQLPHMCHSQDILQLDLGYFEFKYGVDWCCMPPKLRHLKCGTIRSGPPTLTAGQILLPELQSLNVYRIRLPLDALAQLMRMAPSLETFRTWSSHSDDEITIMVSFRPSTAEDLSLLAASKLAFSRDAVYLLDCYIHHSCEFEVAPFLAALPCMAGVTRCEIKECYHQDMAPLLGIFPGIRRLTLWLIEELDDVQLQVVDGCSNLAELELTLCSNVSTMGILALCQSLPGLRKIVCKKCTQLTELALSMCEGLLGRPLTVIVGTEV